MRTPNQFVDQGYHNYPTPQQQQHQQQQQKMVSSSTNEQLNAPRMVQQQQQYQQQSVGPRTHIIPIAIEGSKTRPDEPLSKATVVIPK